MRKDILNISFTVLITTHLFESNRKVEGTGNAGKGTSACNSHTPIMKARVGTGKSLIVKVLSIRPTPTPAVVDHTFMNVVKL